jgi:hypothetical protein
MKKRIKKFNCSPKLNKPVVIPTRKVLLPILEELREQIVNQVLSVDDIIDIIGIHVGERFNVHVKHAGSPQVEQNDIDFNSFYDGGLDEVNEVAIEIYMITNILQDIMIIDEAGFNGIIRKIADNLSHECIHMYQYRSRDFLEVGPFYISDDITEEEENQLYLSDPDEIVAYAHNIANELLEGGDFEAVKLKLDNVKTISLKDSVNLWAYVQAFQEELNHPTMRRLLKKVYQNLIYFSKNH